MSSSSGGGEGEEESAAVVEFAFGADGAAVGEHDVLGDGEAESGAAGFAGAGLVDAVKALEEARKMLGRNAGAEILNIKFNPEFDAAFGGTRAEQNTSARAAVLHGVVDKIRKDLVDGFAVGSHGGQGFDGAVIFVGLDDLQLHSLTAGDLAETLFGIVEELDGGNGFSIEAGLAGFDAGQSQQVFGEARHAGGVLADDFEELAVGAGIFRAEVEECFGVSLNGGQGRAEFVGDVGDEIAAGFFHALGFGEIAEHGDSTAIGEGRGGDVDGGGEAGVLGNEAIHGLIGPLHEAVRTDGDDGILHAVEQSFELALAGTHGSEAAFDLSGGLVDGGGDAANFIEGTVFDASTEVALLDADRDVDDVLEAAGGPDGCGGGDEQGEEQSDGGSPNQAAVDLRLHGFDIRKRIGK